MAENKNSFIIYTDWKQDFEFLTDEEAGKLIKHLLRFASDENPCLEEEDRLLQFAAQKMKSVMKKDLKKYEAVIQKRAEAGKKGGVSSGKSRTSKQKEANEANASDTKQNERINDNVNVNVILLEKETKYVEDVADENRKISEFKNFLKTEKQIQMDRLRMSHKLSDEDLDLKIDEFVEKKVSWGDDDKWRNSNDMAKNFEFWLNKNPKVLISNFQSWDKKKFFDEISNVGSSLSRETKQEFFDHYIQPTNEGNMLFQSFKAWDTKTRIRKWLDNKKQFTNAF